MEKVLVEFSQKTLTQNSNWEVIPEASGRERGGGTEKERKRKEGMVRSR